MSLAGPVIVTTIDLSCACTRMLQEAFCFCRCRLFALVTSSRLVREEGLLDGRETMVVCVSITLLYDGKNRVVVTRLVTTPSTIMIVQSSVIIL